MKDSFNFWQSYAGINIECDFGILVRKSLILSRGIECELEDDHMIIKACFLLHNFPLHDGEIVDNEADIQRDGDGGCNLQPTFISECYTQPHLDDHRAVRSRGLKRSVYRDFSAKDLRDAGILRPGKTVADCSVFE